MWAAEPEQVAAYPLLRLMYAIPNGGERNKIVAARLKAEGVKSGVPDVCLPVARHGVYGLYIEMKKPGTKDNTRKGVVSKNQTNWKEELLAQGYGVATAYSFEEARDILIQYLS